MVGQRKINLPFDSINSDKRKTAPASKAADAKKCDIAPVIDMKGVRQSNGLPQVLSTPAVLGSPTQRVACVTIYIHDITHLPFVK
jgi:hypothetical protein